MNQQTFENSQNLYFQTPSDLLANIINNVTVFFLLMQCKIYVEHCPKSVKLKTSRLTDGQVKRKPIPSVHQSTISCTESYSVLTTI